MEIAELRSEFTVTATPDEPLIDVASRMRFNDVGSAVVVEAGVVVGIITERDLVRAVADGADPRIARVADHMTPEPVTVTPRTVVTDAASTMARLGIAHLPVIDRGSLAGVVSERDIVAELLLELAAA